MSPAGRPGKPWPARLEGGRCPGRPVGHRRAARANWQDVAGTRARLLDEHGIVTTAGAVTRAPREMTAPLLRISPHVDGTPGDLARLRQALLALGLRLTGILRRRDGLGGRLHRRNLDIGGGERC